VSKLSCRAFRTCREPVGKNAPRKKGMGVGRWSRAWEKGTGGGDWGSGSSPGMGSAWREAQHE